MGKYLRIEEVNNLSKGRCCLTCTKWQGRSPLASNHWDSVLKEYCLRAAYCDLDDEFHNVDDKCEEYDSLPGVTSLDNDLHDNVGNDGLDTMEDECREDVLTNKDICDNRIYVEAAIATIPGSRPLQYMVTKIKSEDIPFIGEELRPTLQTLIEAERNDLICKVKNKVESFLESYGFDVDAEIGVVMSPSVYIMPEGGYDKLINLFVDMGSTNCKWIVARASGNGETGGFIDIPLGKPTKELCGEWGIDYDKASAYQLSKQDFSIWLGYAVLGFMLRIQEKHKANVVNLKWSFPRIINGKEIDFDEIGQELSEKLRPYGLRGSFELVPEGIALSCMFKDRLTELAKASDEEEAENKRREVQEVKNREHNKLERRKEVNARNARTREEAEWKKEHWFKKWFCDPVLTTDKYTARLKSESLGREEALKAFRKTGARSDGKFNLLILDAGGSTLDYYFKPISGNVSTGSFEAGGKDVTSRLAKNLSISLEDAEDRKKELSRSATSKLLLAPTEIVYNDSLSTIAGIIGDARPLCVVASGLGMCNPQLRILLSKKLSLPAGQIIIYSPDVASLFPKGKYSVFPKFKAFADIVGRVVENGPQSSLPWPGGDVCGGMYFKVED